MTKDDGLKYCKDCIRAKKPQAQSEVEMWLCGKRRRYITLHTLAPTNCKEYQRKAER